MSEDVSVSATILVSTLVRTAAIGGSGSSVSTVTFLAEGPRQVFYSPPEIKSKHVVRPADRASIPAALEWVACFMISPERQEERLGDLAERFHTTWVPKMGQVGARCCYLWHALGIGKALIVAAVVDRIFRR